VARKCDGVAVKKGDEREIYWYVVKKDDMKGTEIKPIQRSALSVAASKHKTAVT
jgi:hypothetical protein